MNPLGAKTSGGSGTSSPVKRSKGNVGLMLDDLGRGVCPRLGDEEMVTLKRRDDGGGAL